MSQCHDVYDNSDELVFHVPARVRDLMSTDPITVGPATTVKEIASILLHHDIRCVPVVDVGGQLVGVVSEADLICRECRESVRRHSLREFVHEALDEHRHHWSERSMGLTAGEIMTDDVLACGPDDRVADVAQHMLSRGLRTLPVVEAGQLTGVISRHDLLRALDRPDFEVRSRVTQMLDDPIRAPEGHQVKAEVIDGVVILSGKVRYPSDVGVVAAEVGRIPGVLEVVNWLTAERPEPRPSFLRDTDWR